MIVMEVKKMLIKIISKFNLIKLPKKLEDMIKRMSMMLIFYLMLFFKIILNLIVHRFLGKSVTLVKKLKFLPTPKKINKEL